MIRLKRKKSDKNKGVKLKREFEKGGEAGFIRDLAHALESEDAALNPSEDLSDLVRDYGKISIDIKRKGDRVFVKVKVEKQPDSEVLVEGLHRGVRLAGGESDYKNLKKKMKTVFGQLKASCRAGTVPDAGLVKEFCDQSEKMITVPGKGDADYERYITAVHRLNDSISGADLNTIKAAVDEIGRICKECHGKYA